MTFDTFFDRLGDFDWLGIIVGTLVLMVFGALWFTPLFGKQWSAATGQAMETSPEPAKMAMHGVAMLVYNIGLAYFLVDGLEESIVTGGIVIGVLLVGAMQYTGTIWAKYPPKAFAIDLPYYIIGTALAMWVQSLFI